MQGTPNAAGLTWLREHARARRALAAWHWQPRRCGTTRDRL